MIVREIPAAETKLAIPALQALRPAWDDADALVAHVDGVLRAEGYRLAGAFGDDGPGSALAVAGFRVQHMLFSGRMLYVDDLSTLPEARGRGLGRALLDWVAEEARRLACDAVHLDSGVGADRAAAHRLYHAAGMRISAHHFERAL